jgi:integrase
MLARTAAAAAPSATAWSRTAIKLAAITEAHRMAHLPDPTADEDVRTVMAGIRRELGTAPKKKAPVTLDELRKLVRPLPRTLAGKRDRALLLVGWAGAFRRSELVALNVDDLRFGQKLTISLRRSKTDQEGKGLAKVVPRLEDETICPVRALREWLDAAGIKSGPVFRRIDRWDHVRDTRLTAQSVALIVKDAAKQAGLDYRQLAGHSLRSGFITEAADAGVESRDIMAQTGHKSEAVMRGYIRDAGHGAMNAVRAAFGEKRDE